MKRSLITILTLLLSTHLSAADPAATRGKIEQALGGSIRDAAEVARDANRKPGAVLEFFGLNSISSLIILKMCDLPLPGGINNSI